MIKIDWKQDYKQEFICPRCEKREVRFFGFIMTDKKRFKCDNCGRIILESCQSKSNKKISIDPYGNSWSRGQKMDNFVCPNCQDKNIYFLNFKKGKKWLQCKTCKKLTFDSIDITPATLARYSHREPAVKPFIFENDIWDLRAINSSSDKRRRLYIINFNNIKSEWFKPLVKLYVYHLCKLNARLASIDHQMTSLRFLSRYLVEKNITDINQINRSIILDFLSGQSSSRAVTHRVACLKDFFYVGTVQKWFDIDQDIIRNDDYPKYKCGNPDPISDVVREQIEKNLHKLPDFIARMWLISFFTAMRPSELAFLKKDCLVQEGANWKIVWERQKRKDQHEVPVTRTIAEVIQQQQEYINNLWGNDWNYLFCHYQDISKKSPTQLNIKPVKKVIPGTNSPLEICIRCLIKSENIRDENDKLAKFTPSLLRSTRLTELFEQGHDLNVVSAWAGHKHLATTSLHYTKVSCTLLEQEVGHIQKALFNANGKPLYYESMPKSFWENPRAHQIELSGDHINTPIYGFCGLPLDERCDKFRACYTCSCFVAQEEKLPQYIKIRSELRDKESRALSNGHDVLVEQFGIQAWQLEKIINSLESAT
jgi:integrase/transcription elongation factor Elf1